jgi:hypothetical protein
MGKMVSNDTIRLSGGKSAEITEGGQVIIHQDAEHAVELEPNEMYELVTWLLQDHMYYLGAQSEPREDVEAEKRAYDYEVWSMKGGGW